MRNIFEYYDENDHLSHHGILGQKWGIRRYQNKDGSLTEAGIKRYNTKGEKGIKGFDKKAFEDWRKRKDIAEKPGKLDRARKEGLYELDFLEAVQNSKILHNGDTKALLTEYAKYLDDRDAYWELGRKLPPA